MAKVPEDAKAPPVRAVKGVNIPEDAIQLVSCEVATGPNHETIVPRSPFNPVTYPETLLLDRLHAQPGKAEPVRRVKHAGYVIRSFRAEKQRLVEKYGLRAVEAVFPGRNPEMERFNRLDAPNPGTKCVSGDFVGMAPEPKPAAKAAAKPALDPKTEIEPDPAE